MSDDIDRCEVGGCLEFGFPYAEEGVVHHYCDQHATGRGWCLGCKEKIDDEECQKCAVQDDDFWTDEPDPFLEWFSGEDAT